MTNNKGFKFQVAFEHIFGITGKQAQRIEGALSIDALDQIGSLLHEADEPGEARDSVKQLILFDFDNNADHVVWRERELASICGVATGAAKTQLSKMNDDERLTVDLALLDSVGDLSDRQRVRQAWIDCVQRVANDAKAERAKAAGKSDPVPEPVVESNEAAVESEAGPVESDDSVESGESV